MNTVEFVRHHGAHAEHTVRSFVDPGRPVAHVWFEESFNFGDAGIWCGQDELLARMNVDVRYTCSYRDYDEAAMRAAIGDNGTIVIRGGGNFGDLYVYHSLRLRIFDAFRANPIVQLPQTARFNRSQSLCATRSSIEQCEDVTLLARDARTCALFMQHFDNHGTRVIACPDVAFASGGRERPLAPSFDVVALMRTDRESKFPVRDGMIFGETTRRELDIVRKGNIRISGNAPGGQVITIEIAVLSDRDDRVLLTDWYLSRIVAGKAGYEALSFADRARLGRDIADRVLSRGRVLITDRLHAHIFALQLGIPHVVVDNNYGKLSSYYRTWTRHCDIVRFADDFQTAVRLARSLLPDNRRA